MAKKTNPQKIILLLVIAIALIIISNKGISRTQLLGACAAGNSSFKGINIEYDICPEHDSMNAIGSLHHDASYYSSIVTLSGYSITEQSITGAAAIGGESKTSLITGDVSHTYNIGDSQDVNSVSFTGYIKGECDGVSKENSNSGLIISVGGQTIYSNTVNCDSYFTGIKPFSTNDFIIKRTSTGWLFTDLEGHSTSSQTNTEGNITLTISLSGTYREAGTKFEYSINNILISKTQTITDCPYQCCKDTSYKNKACNQTGYECVSNSCLSTTITKQNCPYDCCLGMNNYTDKTCSSGKTCVNNQCSTPTTELTTCPYQCCYQKTGYLDKACPSDKTCTGNFCVTPSRTETTTITETTTNPVTDFIKEYFYWIIGGIVLIIIFIIVSKRK